MRRGAIASSRPAPSGAWSVTGPMQDERYWFAATTLLSGKVLLTGGYSYESYDLASAELYNGATEVDDDRADRVCALQSHCHDFAGRPSAGSWRSRCLGQ